MVDMLTFAGLAASTCFMFAVMGVQSMRPKASRACCGVVLAIWFWNTSIWASSTKRLIADAGSGQLAPSCWWLTMLPHLLSCGPLLLVAGAQEGAATIKDHMMALFLQPSLETFCWYVAGGCYFFGQLFTVLALTGASPLVVMVVKALEPLVTATLAILALGQEVRWALLGGILVACSGIVLAILGAPSGPESILQHHSLRASIAAAFMANLGFGSRACMVKRAYARSRVEPLVAISTITVTGVIMGSLPLVFCPSVVSIGKSAMDNAGAHHVGLWIAAAVSYLMYQAASLFLLEAFAVESHALLVAVKHVFTALSATVLVGGELSGTTLLGCSILLLGILLYTASPSPAAPSAKQVAAEPPEAAPLQGGGAAKASLEQLNPFGVARADRPPLLLFAICAGLVACGTAVLVVATVTTAAGGSPAVLARPGVEGGLAGHILH